MDPVQLDGVDTERSRSGTASSAIDGDVLGDGESGRCSGEARPLSVSCWLVEGLDVVSTTSAMLARRVKQSPFESCLSAALHEIKKHKTSGWSGGVSLTLLSLLARDIACAAVCQDLVCGNPTAIQTEMLVPRWGETRVPEKGPN